MISKAVQEQPGSTPGWFGRGILTAPRCSYWFPPFPFHSPLSQRGAGQGCAAAVAMAVPPEG